MSGFKSGWVRWVRLGQKGLRKWCKGWHWLFHFLHEYDVQHWSVFFRSLDVTAATLNLRLEKHLWYIGFEKPSILQMTIPASVTLSIKETVWTKMKALTVKKWSNLFQKLWIWKSSLPSSHEVNSNKLQRAWISKKWQW